ncbi:MAG: hypothetical protein ACXABD_16300 [Candidatus Thorarchaeota archaeon]|jgi:hypothetical protein
MKEKFVVGDVVKMLTSDQEMVVISAWDVGNNNERQNVETRWIRYGRVYDATFPAEVLVKSDW